MKKFQSGIGMVVVLAMMVVTASAQSYLTNGLVAYYPLNGNANDASGKGLNGVASSKCASTTDRFGNVAGAIFITNIQGSAATDTGRIDVPPAAIDSLTAGTISTWIMPQDITFSDITAKQHDLVNTYAVLSIGGYTSPGGGPTLGNPGTIYFHAKNFSPLASSTATVVSNVWQHVVVVFNATVCTFYLNGVQCGSMAGNFSIPSDLSANATCIGCWAGSGWGSGQRSIGSFDDVRIYNFALTSNQVVQLYQVESLPPMVITQDLTNSSVLNGQNISLGVTAAGGTQLSYQWYFNGPTNLITAGAYAQTASGSVNGAVVTNGGAGYGTTPYVSFVGGGGTGAAGYGTVTNGVVTGITVTNTGGGYISLPTVVIGAPNGYANGQTNNTLNIANASPTNAGNYYVVVSDIYGSITSSVVTLTILSPPTITTNPVGFTANLHGSGSLGVSAMGTAPLTYQWMLNNTNVYGATNSTLAINSLSLTNAGSYVVAVTNAYGYATSSIANVELSPSLTSPFAGATGLWGQNILLGVGAVGSGTLNYQWYFNGMAIAGANGSNYALNSVQFTNAGLYSVVVSSVYGSVTNTAYQVVVNPVNTGIGTCPIIYITGTAGYNYTIQSITYLGDTNWVTLTNITLTSSSLIWADTATDTTQPANRMKFYRVIPGQ